MGCGVTFVKYVLFFFNLLVALTGLALIGVGVAAKLKYAPITDLIAESKFEIAPVLSIVVGCIVFVIAFYGCCGAIRESNCMLVLYAVFLFVLIVAQVVMATLLFINLPAAHEAINTWITKAFQDTSVESVKAFATLQTAFQCCGTSGPASYLPTVILPQSCCATTILDQCTGVTAFQRGCVDTLTEFIKGTGGTFGGLALGIAGIELVGVVFALCLANHARNMERRW